MPTVARPLRSPLALMLLLLATATHLPAQGPTADASMPSPSRDVPFVPNERPSLQVRRVTGEIEIDGELDDAGWRDAARATNFAEKYPGDQTRPPVETEAMMTYDDRNLYVAFIAHDDPATIRATLHDRDMLWDEDMCGLIVDTYGDAAWAYELFVNALGVQGDLFWSAGGSEDEKFDMVFTSRARITPQGYQIEMAIPFSSLRFPDRPSQSWKATFWRIHPRDSRREYTWAALSRDNACEFCQYGTITGIEKVKPGTALELLPSVAAHQSGRLSDPADPDAAFDDSKIDGSFSLGARYAFSPSVVADLTYNPDFSQVESDAAQVNVNTTFALSYPERRPFFQEGSDLFDTPLSAVYTRSINDPLAAARVTARLGSTSIAYVGAYDENSPIILPFEERSIFVAGGRSLSNILRASHTFADNSYVGGIMTDRRFEGGGSGTLVGVDGQIRFADIYRLRLQALASSTAEPSDSTLGPVTNVTFDDRRRTAKFDGEKFRGTGLYTNLRRDGRLWSFNLEYYDRSPGFRTYNGFTTRNDMRQVEGRTGCDLYPALGWLDKISPNVDMARIWNHAGTGKDMWIVPAIDMDMKAQTHLRVSYLASHELFRGIDFPGIRRFAMNVNSNFSTPVSAGCAVELGRWIARTLDTPELGRGSIISLWATLRPMERLNIQPSLDYSDLYHEDGREIFSGYIFRAKFNYQFTRELYLRLVAQYDGFDRAFALEPLLTYKINPFTIFYVGSSHDFAEFPSEDRYAATSRQFFAKFQYLVQI